MAAEFFHSYYIYCTRSTTIFIALRWHSKIGMGYAYEHTYQDREYVIRTMNTKCAQYICMLHIQLVTKPYSFPVPSCTQDCIQLYILSASVIKLFRQC